MTVFPFQDAVAIDTNVFEHLLNPEHNADKHIGRLLGYLQSNKTSLMVDNRGRITGEYSVHIMPIIKNAKETGNEVYLLRYWIAKENQLCTTVELQDELMKEIKRVVKEPNELADQTFVYVAFKRGRGLISNDRKHIVDGPPRENKQGRRADRLLRETKRVRPDGAEILTSQEAHARI